jgi:hypothetical protein
MAKSPPSSHRSQVWATLACIPGTFGFLLGFAIQPYLSRHFAELSPPLKYFHRETTYWDHPLYVLAILSVFTLWAVIYQIRTRKHPIEYLFFAINCCYVLLCLLAWVFSFAFSGPS